MAYNKEKDKDKDYQALINDAVKSGNYAEASRLEQDRNEKIDVEGLNYTKTSNYVKPKGVDDATYNKMQNTSFNASSAVQGATQVTADALHKVNKLTNTDSIITDSTRNAMNGSFRIPGEVKAADRYLAEQLQKIQSGKTSYSDQLQEMMDKIMNRDKFSYDVDQDPLFQQALASAMNSGKQAMQDTIGQASALTGGYGSTYATTAGNQAYNAFIEDAYDNLPQYYQMALEAYQMEGDEMYRQYGMLSDADDKEFGRYVTAFDATSQHRNRLYDEAYQQYRDGKSDAFNMANLERNEHGQLVSDAYNYYNAASNYSDTLYEREYAKWADEINMAYKYAEMQNSDWWNQTNYDESVRQYEQNFAYQKERDAAADAKWEKEYAETVRMNNAQLAKMRSSGSGGSGGSRCGSGGGSYKLSTTEINGLNDAYKNGGVDGALAYLNAVGKAPSDDYSISVVENLLAQADAQIISENEKIEAEKQANTPKTGARSVFRSKSGDNFFVKVGTTSYGVENHGKVTDSTLLNSLNKLNTRDDTAFLHNGDVYVKSGGGYYEIGAKAFGGKKYEELRKALQK